MSRFTRLIVSLLLYVTRYNFHVHKTINITIDRAHREEIDLPQYQWKKPKNIATTHCHSVKVMLHFFLSSSFYFFFITFFFGFGRCSLVAVRWLFDKKRPNIYASVRWIQWNSVILVGHIRLTLLFIILWLWEKNISPVHKAAQKKHPIGQILFESNSWLHFVSIYLQTNERKWQR